MQLTLSVTRAAESPGVIRKTFSMLLNGKSGISPEMALRLSRVFGRTPEGWLSTSIRNYTHVFSKVSGSSCSLSTKS